MGDVSNMDFHVVDTEPTGEATNTSTVARRLSPAPSACALTARALSKRIVIEIGEQLNFPIPGGNFQCKDVEVL